MAWCGTARGLTPDVRRVGWLVASSSFDCGNGRFACPGTTGSPRVAIDQAIDEGIIERDGDVLRFTHPSLQSALYAEMSPAERRHVHQRRRQQQQARIPRTAPGTRPWVRTGPTRKPPRCLMPPSVRRHGEPRGGGEAGRAGSAADASRAPGQYSRPEGPGRRLSLPRGRHGSQRGGSSPPWLPARPARRCSSGWPQSTTTSAAGRSPSRRSGRRSPRRPEIRPCARTLIEARIRPRGSGGPSRCPELGEVVAALGRAGGWPAPDRAHAGPRRHLRVPPGEPRTA